MSMEDKKAGSERPAVAYAGYLEHPFKKGTLRSDRSRRKGERMSSWKENVSWARDAVW
jgi:hypothetical protein